MLDEDLGPRGRNELPDEPPCRAARSGHLDLEREHRGLEGERARPGLAAHPGHGDVVFEQRVMGELRQRGQLLVDVAPRERASASEHDLVGNGVHPPDERPQLLLQRVVVTGRVTIGLAHVFSPLAQLLLS